MNEIKFKCDKCYVMIHSKSSCPHYTLSFNYDFNKGCKFIVISKNVNINKFICLKYYLISNEIYYDNSFTINSNYLKLNIDFNKLLLKSDNIDIKHVFDYLGKMKNII